MLNTETKQVFEILRSLTGEDGNFKIIEAEEVLEKLPEGRDMTKVELSAIIKDLKSREYLKVKYFTPDEYCILTLHRQEDIQKIVEEVTTSYAAAGVVVEQAEQNKTQKNIVVNKGLVFITSFFGAFLGGGVLMALSIVLQIYLV